MKSVFFAVLVCFLAVSQVSAGPDRVSILLGSKHVGGHGFNEKNPGLFFTWEGGRVDWTAGVFRNSYAGTSASLTGALPFWEWRGGQAAAFAGVAYYPEAGTRFNVSFGDLVPIGGLQVRHGNFFGQLVPMDGRPVDALLTFGVTFGIN